MKKVVEDTGHTESKQKNASEINLEQKKQRKWLFLLFKGT